MPWNLEQTGSIANKSNESNESGTCAFRIAARGRTAVFRIPIGHRSSERLPVAHGQRIAQSYLQPATALFSF
jgi:hypothetical protein